LRIIAGLESADNGTILFNDRETTHIHARDRGVGFVFQHYALFRHMTVFENVAFGLRVKPRSVRPSNLKIDERVSELLKLVQLDWMGQRYPSQLSGGQRQRVALARALAVEPQVLLLDEPFGALDAKVRKELRRWLRRLHDEVHLTSIFVTHDVEEALEVADRIVVMNEGRIEQTGTPDAVYDKPANPFVYQFLGNVNLFHTRIHEGLLHVGDLKMKLAENTGNQAAVAYARPHEIEIKRELHGDSPIRAKIVHILPAGPVVKLELKRHDTDDIVDVEMSKDHFRELKLVTGEDVFVHPKNITVFAHDYII
jgi:sulfate transport system ATP-binding protein